MIDDDTRLDDMIREHYVSRQPPPDRLAALEDAIGPAPSVDRTARFRLTRRGAAGLAACLVVSAAAGAVLALSLRPAAVRRPVADIVALQFYAEWCTPSQVVARRVAALREAAGDGTVLFLRLDLSDDERREQAHLLVDSLGYGDIWDAQQGRTGELLLIDAGTMRLITTLNQDNDAEQMIVALTNAIAQAAVP